MHRFYLPREQCAGPVLRLEDREAHHALHVLRLRAGDRVTVLDGAGGQYECEVASARRAGVELAVRHQSVAVRPACAVVLVQALPKGKLLETIIQKATELGAARVVPLVTARVVSQVDGARAAKKSEHWRQVAIEAIKQCGNPWLPRIDEPVNLRTFLACGETFDLSLVGSLRESRRRPRDWWQEFTVQHGRPPASVALWIGPEGDFTPDELDAIERTGARPVSFGPLVLRCDTAAVYALSVVGQEWQPT